MSAVRTEFTELIDAPAPVRTKLAAAWTSFMFLYIYVDYLHLYKPGAVRDILAGVVWEFDISEAFAAGALASVSVPIFMILLSTTLPARVARATNLIVATLYVPYSVFNMVGGSWVFFYGFGVALELVLLAFVLRLAWTWPRSSSTTAGRTLAASPTLNR